MMIGWERLLPDCCAVSLPSSAPPSRRLLNTRTGEQIAHQACQPVNAEVDVCPCRIDVDARHEQLNDASLLGWEKLIPQWVEAFERVAYIGLGKVVYRAPRSAPGLDEISGARRSART
jgi:hypothetical protein